MSVRILVVAAYALLAGFVPTAMALDPAAVQKLATGDSGEKIEAIGALVAEGDSRAIPVLEALGEGELQTAGKRVLIVKGDRATDALSGGAVTPLPTDREDVVANNRVRGAATAALAALKLVAPDRQTRLAAAKALAGGADEAMLLLVRKALDRETDPAIRPLLELATATIELKGDDRERRLAAVLTLGQSANPSAKTLPLPAPERGKDGAYAEPDEEIRRKAQASLREVEGRLAWSERLALAFVGVSLGSILLLAALGLAITYGLMGVINMAHGELIMIGAYATYVVQNLFRAHAPRAFHWDLACAVPISFAASAAVGMALERLVIRFLYGRPLETLLATWGIGLILIQAVRTVFGAQNVGVENPSFMSGGVEVLPDVVLPWSRIVIIFFAAAVLAGVALLLTRTRFGLFVRGVTQNRAMAACVGVPTARVDMWAFGLGAGIAGLAGCALSQIGNVGPDLGQAYIVDSFMVVVLGGVGQLAGTVYAALGLGIVNKLIESWQGAVIAKILVLIFIVVFIQKRPQGLFAVKGRAAEA